MMQNHKIIRASRLIIALAASIIVNKLLNIPMSGWILVTIIVVLFEQTTVGGIIGKSVLRLIATLLSAIISLICIIFFKDNWLLIWSFLAISSFAYAYYYMDSKKSYVGILGIATIPIVLLSNNNPDLHTALYRLLDIVVGISFAILAMFLIFPEYALNKSKSLIFSSLRDISELLSSINSDSDSDTMRQQIIKVENKFVNDIVNFNKTIAEAQYEWQAKQRPHLIVNYRNSFLQIRRLYRLIIIIFFYELDNHKHNAADLKQIFDLILNILAELNPKVTITFNSLAHEKLAAAINNLKDQSFRKTALHFHQELQELNRLLIT